MKVKSLQRLAFFFALAFLLAAAPLLASAAASPFKDVKKNHWAYSSIEWAYEQGISKGYKGNFEPDKTVTEAQFVSMLVRLDCSAPSYATTSSADSYLYLQNKNLPLKGATSKAARTLPITKGQVARIAAAYRGIDLTETRAVQYLYKNDLANGMTGKNDFNDYGANLTMTRADAVVFLQRLADKGSCKMTGLQKRPSGSDDKTIALPPNFLAGSTITFDPPTTNQQQPVVVQPTVPPSNNAAFASIDVAKTRLNANGIDSTFITVSLNSCGIEYGDSLPYTVTSAVGAKLNREATIIPPKYNLAEARERVKSAEARLAAEKRKVDEATATLKYWEDYYYNSNNGQYADIQKAIYNAKVAVAEAQYTMDIMTERLNEADRTVIKAQEEVAYWQKMWDSVNKDGSLDFTISGPARYMPNEWNHPYYNSLQKAKEALRVAQQARGTAAQKLTDAKLNYDKALTNLKYWEAQLPQNNTEPKQITKAKENLAAAKRTYDAAEKELLAARQYLAQAEAESNNRPSGSSLANMTDGPDMLVEVVAPALTQSRVDTITFQMNSQNSNCANTPITVNLEYVAQPTLHLEIIRPTADKLFDGTLPADGTTAVVRATIMAPGGQVLQNYNGQVRFSSSNGGALTENIVRFVNGVATTSLTTPNTAYSMKGEITAQLSGIDPAYQHILAPIANSAETLSVRYDPLLKPDTSCTSEIPEIAFVLDASGSMKRSDPFFKRVEKSQELMQALQAQRNIAAQFNSSGKLLHPTADVVDVVKPTLIKVGAGGGTSIKNGLQTAFNAFSPGTAPKVAILLTDGKSNKKEALSMMAQAKKQNIKIYTIGLGSKKQLDEELLKELAKGTDGHYYHVEHSEDLSVAFQSILSAVTCNTPPISSCGISSSIFTEPTLRTMGNEFLMSTFVDDNCGEVTRVVLRFNSVQGDIDYELAHRNQGYFELKKGTYEIHNFQLLREGTFLAYNAKGELVGEKRIMLR